MTTLNRLPTEIILQILRYLPLSTVENVAHTYNHAITDLCLVLLQPVFKSRRVLKRLKTHFNGKVQNDLPLAMLAGLGSASVREMLGLPLDARLMQPAIPRNTEYLELSGDLYWLHPPCATIARHMARYNRSANIQATAIDDLVATAARTGVTIPVAFLNFFRDTERLKYIVKTDASRFELLAGGLRKVPKSMDGGVGGYIIGFLAGMQHRIFLYLEPGEDGGYGLLEEQSSYCDFCDSDDDSKADLCPRKNRGITEEDKKEAEALGLQMMSYNPCTELALVGTDFEAWLVARYYEEWLWFVGMRRSVATPPLQEYVRQNMVLKPGRVDTS